MSLHEINEGIHKHKKITRIGRGIGSGHGKTSGKGHKGQMARAGWKASPIWQGGAQPLVRRVPKRGFTNFFAAVVGEVNVAALECSFEAGEAVTPESLVAKGLVSRKAEIIKILANGDLKKQLSVTAHRFSASAKEKIEKAGGTVTEVAVKVTVGEKRAAAEAASPKAKGAKRQGK